MPASTSTDPRLDNEELVPRVEALGQAEKSGDAAAAARLRGEIAAILRTEVERRYRLIAEALALCQDFPASEAALHIQAEDRAQHDRNFAYVANPENHLAAGLSGNAATAEFLSRELNADHHDRLMIRSVSGARSAARLSGDVLRGEVIAREAWKTGRRTTVKYRIRTVQERLSVRRGDKLSPLDDDTYRYCVEDVATGEAGDTTVTLDLINGKTKAGQPGIGDRIELAEPLSTQERIARTMGIAHERLRTKPAAQPVQHRLRRRQNYLARIRALRSDT
jgi:hypothetical protein